MSLLRPALSVLRTILDDPSNTGEKSFRLFAAAAWQIYKRSVPFPIVLPLDNGISFIADPASGNSVGAIYTKIYESQYIVFARKHMEKHGVLCDVGAHAGLCTLLLAPGFRQAVLFEPEPATFLLLKRNLLINAMDYAIPIQAAASDHRGTGKLKVTGKYSGTTRLARSNEEGLDESSPSVALVTVDETFANLNVRSISFLKVDTEGHELQVLKGCRRILTNSPGALVLYENSQYDGVRDYFSELGWKVFGVDQHGQMRTNDTELRNAYNLFACGPNHQLYDSFPATPVA